jgi:hypothetical protein
MATSIIVQLPISRSIHCAIDNIAERSYTIDSIAEHSYTVYYREKQHSSCKNLSAPRGIGYRFKISSKRHRQQLYVSKLRLLRDLGALSGIHFQIANSHTR